MTGAAIGLRRLASQRVLGERFERPADVVRWLGAVQAQDYNQALWAIGARLRRGTAALVERAIEGRQIVRTWLLRGTIHFAPPEDVRWLLALCAPRLAVTEERRRAQLGITSGELDRSRELVCDALAGDRRLSRPDLFRLLQDAGIQTSGNRGYHILVQLTREALICIGPMQGKQPTLVLLDDWAPRAEARDLSRAEALADLAGRFVASRAPATDRDLATWAGITLADARSGLRSAAAPVLLTRELDGVEYWFPADQVAAAPPRGGRRRGYLLPAYDEFLLGYKDRAAQLPGEHAGKIVPGGNGVFTPLIVVGGEVAGTWGRRRGEMLTMEVHPFALRVPEIAELVLADAERYRRFLGLPASTPVEIG